MKRDQSSRTRPPRILWGRVAFYALSLVIVFALGAWSAGDDSADAELEEARAEIERLSQENLHLRAERDALEAGEALEAEEASAQDGDSEEGDPGGSADAEPEGSAAAGSEAAADDAETADAGDADTAEADEPDDAAATEPGSSTYVVREGDTGRSIAEAVYGDQDLWPLIAEANDLGGDNLLQVDQELVIPPSD